MQTPRGPSVSAIHASCASRCGDAVLLLGPPGAGKSDLLLRLLDCGFDLVADDRVEIAGGVARAPAALAGLMEVRGLGIVRLPHVAQSRLRLAVQLQVGPRLPHPASLFGVPVAYVDPAAASAPRRVALALDCALGRVQQLAGAFAA